MLKKYFFLFLLAGSLLFVGASCIQFGGGGQGTAGVFRSDNGGDTWLQKAALPTAQGVKSLAGLKVYRIFIDPGDPNALYLGTRGQGLYYSYDKGDSWQVATAMSNKFIYGLAVDPRDKCTIYVSDETHIYKTTDCSRSWILVFTEGRPTQRFVGLAVDNNNSKMVYGAEWDGDVLKSDDGGISWHIIKRFDFQLRGIAVDPLNSGRVYVAAYINGLYRSDDGGATWINLDKGFENFSDSLTFYRLVLNPAQKDSLFWVSKYGILRSNDAGATWNEVKLLTPPGSVYIYGFAVNPKNQAELYYTGTILSDKSENVRSTLYKSADGGKSWVTKKLPTNTIPVDMLVHRENGKSIFIGFTGKI